MSYRFERFRREHLREGLAFPSGKDPGWQSPDFDLPTTQGGRFRKSDFLGQRPLLLAFASLTDPVAASAASTLKALYQRFGRDVAFVTVYVRESHPGDHIRQPATMDWKMRHARMLQDRDAIPWRVAVDDLDGTFHRAFGARGASAHLLDARGNVRFQAVLSNDGRALLRGLEALRAGDGSSWSEGPRLGPALCGLARTDDVVRAAGPRALDDLRRETPLLYAAAQVAWAWRVLTPLGRFAVAAAGAFGALAAVALVNGAVLGARRRIV